jgi:hypothetical protein
MAVQETGVSYYGISHTDSVSKDFDEIRAHNCTAIVLALTEFDMFFWKPQIPLVVDAAKRAGLKVYLNTWGIGKFFGGEAPSLFLQECDLADRQFTAVTGSPVPAASPSSPAFREYVWERVDELSKTCDADGFFWDEPHYAMPIYQVGYQSSADWTCRSPISQASFQTRYGYEMPLTLTRQVRRFRHAEANDLLIECSRIARSNNPALTVTQCCLPADNNYYASFQRGFDDWEAIASRADIDVFSTSIITDYSLPLSVHAEIADATVALARKHGKKSQRWVMSYFKSPRDLEDMKRIVRLYAQAGVESVFSWTYRAGQGTFLAAPDPVAAWHTLGQAYAEALEI